MIKLLIFLFSALTVVFLHSAHAQSSAPLMGKERKVLVMVEKLPEVVKREQYVEKMTKGKRHLMFYISEKPTKKQENFWVKVAEDNGASYFTHFNFAVNPNSYVIKYYDTITGNLISLKAWRNQK